ncbi:hypothetical protein FKN25_19065 [Vibrio sp. 3-2(1)]|nr:hypothetical protein [Vibrio sp. 3-2(1)]
MSFGAGLLPIQRAQSVERASLSSILYLLKISLVELVCSKTWFVVERWTLFWRLIYHGSGFGWSLNYSTIAIVAFHRVKSVYLIEFA